MLEDISIMEKKPNGRSNLPPAKAGTEGKKTGETPTFGKNNRRRESSSSNNSKNDPNRKTNPTKQGNFSDKRPRPRSQNYGGGKSETKLGELDMDPEYGSPLGPGKRKQNLNHLLNFTLAPRPAVGSGSSSLLPREKPSNWLATHKHKYNKEQFLQANCQFIVKSGVDYSVHLVDPDILVEWSNIEQIVLRSTEWLACPICLDTPVAAKMTRCGHVYCWPCILHYLALSDKTWRKCPICYESVHKKDLKGVITVANVPCRVGEQFTFKLMKRERGTLLPIPVEEGEVVRQSDKPLCVNEPVLNTAYSKLLLAAPSDVKRMLQLERLDLEAQLKSSEGEPEVCFVEQALELLSERELTVEKNEELVVEKNEELVIEKIDNDLDKFKEGGDSNCESIPVVADPFAEEEAVGEGTDVGGLMLRSEEAVRLAETVEEVENDDDLLPNVSPEDIETESQVAGQKPFYFYQAVDGQNVFLTALNLRMLETQYGGLVHAPLTISGPVLEKESGSMTRELRNRLRSLSHLPITAAFELLELNLSSWVSEDVLEAFAEPLRVRDDRRRRRERDERRRERRIILETGKQWGQCPAPRIRLDSAKHFPKCGEEDPPLASSRQSMNESRSNSLSSLASVGLDLPEQNEQPTPEPLVLPPSPNQNPAGPSFAQMLKVGARSNISSKKPTWVKPAPVAVPGDGEDEYATAPRFQQSFSDAIALALERADLNADAGGSSKRKKKRKQKVLFSSGMSFASK